uniref:Mediator of RNA polymerase II transcription subunit 15 n=1 Tax=Romanomermis culicivorax TaxID=13658 RepID=A0A915KSV0_ROMCU
MSKKRLAKKSAIPLALEREIAFLDRKFDIKIKEKLHKSKEFINLICNIKDPNLPIVPPLLITVCQDYPATGPKYAADASDYRIVNSTNKM